MTLFAKLNHFIPLYIFNCKLFIYSLSEQNTIVNYDSETDKFSTFFDNFKKELEPKFNKDTLNFAKQFSDMKGKIDLDDLTSQFKEVDSSVIDMAKSVQDGSMSMDEFTEKSTKATTTTSRFSSVAKSVGTAIKSIGATAANMIGGFLIAEGILYHFLSISVSHFYIKIKCVSFGYL